MKRLSPIHSAALAALLIALSLAVPQARAGEFSGFVAAEARAFENPPLFPGQKRDTASLALQPEYYREQGSGSVTVVPFIRLDSADSERSHFDIRELNYLWLGENWEMRLGLAKIFWGAAEFVHLVDIINQTDSVEALDGEEKLGQPMLHFSSPMDAGIVDLFLLPWFRERTFPGREGRLRYGPMINPDMTRYESGAGEHHPDFAIRYSTRLGNGDLGIYQFRGTSREPTLLAGLNSSGQPVLIPFYRQINQTGLDAQLAAGNWLWKLEALHRTGMGEGYSAAVGGAEYTLYSILESSLDLGLIGELAYDDRRRQATTPFENDAMLGLRLTVNDAASTEFLAGLGQDLDSSARTLSIEASRRIGNRTRIIIEGTAFMDIPADDRLFSLRDDDFLQVTLACYF